MIVVDAKAPNFASRAGSHAVIDMVEIRIHEREIASIACDGPCGVVAGNVIDGHIVCKMPINAMDGVCCGQIRRGGANIKILYGEILHGAMVAGRGMDGHGLLTVCAAGAVGGVLDDAVCPAIDDDVVHAVYMDGTVARPIRRRENRSGEELDGDGSAGSA